MTTVTKTSKNKTGSPTWLEEHTPAVRGVYAALTAHPGSTATELAEQAGVGRSTATKALVTLESAGHAHRTSAARTDSGRRAPDLWQPTATTKTPAPKPAPVAADTPRATAPKAAPVPAAPANKRPTAPTGATPPDPAASRPPVAVPEGKLRNGQLTQLVMDQLSVDPAQEWTVRDLWKCLDRSQGAISNALERATIKGTAIRTSDAPRRYRLSAPPAVTPEEPADGDLVTAGAPAPGPRRGRLRRTRS